MGYQKDTYHGPPPCDDPSTLKGLYPPPPDKRVSTAFAGAGSGTTYVRATHNEPPNSADYTTSDCIRIPLKGGGTFKISYTRWSGMDVPLALPDGWAAAGQGGIFSFLPFITLYTAPDPSRFRISAAGSVLYNGSDVPNQDVNYKAFRGLTYWTEYNQTNGSYFEYFAGSSVLSSDPMFGRLNRIYDTSGNALTYTYSANASGIRLLRKITGLGGSLVPYFGYAADAGPIKTVYLADVTNAANNRAIYFEYNADPALVKVVNPAGCTRQYQLELAIATTLHKITAEVDPEAYTTYFDYGGTAYRYLYSIFEPGNRTTYHEYDLTGFGTNRIQNGRPKEMRYYVNGGLGSTSLVTKDTDALGRTTYFLPDASVYRVGWEKLPNGRETYYRWVGGTPGAGNNAYALRSVTTTYNGAQTYYDYSPKSFSKTMEIGPRHVPGVFPVVSYFAYDASWNLVRSVDPLVNSTYYGYDAIGLKIRELDPAGYATYYFYDGLGNATSIIDPTGAITYYTYDLNYGDKITEISARWKEPGTGFAKFRTYFGYDKLDRVIKAVDPLNNATYFEWTSRGDLMGRVDALGTRTDYTYDGLRKLMSSTVKNKAGTQLTQELFGVDTYLNFVRTQDGLGNVTYFDYDVVDRPTSTQDAIGGRPYYFYDSADNIICSIDALQRATYFRYDPLSRLIAKQDTLGNTTYFSYDLANNRISEVDALVAATYYFYDTLNRIQATRDALGNSSYFFYDSVGNLTSMRNALGRATYFFFDGRKSTTATRDVLGVLTYFGYDAAGNRTRLVDARNALTYFTYDSIDQLQTKLDAVGNRTYFFYDGVGNTTVVRDARANAIYYFYDGLSRVAAQRDALGNPTYFFYDAVSNLTHRRDARGNTTYFFYDALQRRTIVRDALGNGIYFAYDAVGNHTRSVNAQAHVTYFTYDALQRLTQTLTPEQARATFVYDAVGNLVVVGSEDTFDVSGYGVQAYGTSFYGGWLPANTRTFYDALRRPTSRVDALGNSSYFFYNSVGNRTVRIDPLSSATYFGYDALNRLLQTQDALGGTTYFEYDLVGNPSKIVDANSQSFMTQFDNLNRASAIRMADGGSSYFFYDQANSQVKVVDGRGNSTYFGYDKVNRATKLVDTLNRTLYFEYDAVSNVSKAVDAEGASSATSYDALSHLTQVTYALGGSIISAGLGATPYYVYDTVGNTVQMGDLWGLHRFGYDGLQRIVRHVFPKGQTVYYQYGPRAQILGVVYPGSQGQAYFSYDLLLRQKVAQAPSGATAYFGYDAASNQILRLLGNGARQDVTYDSAERIAQWRSSDKNGASLTYFDYTRDAKGLVTKAVRESTYTVYYAYDPSDRLSMELWATTGLTPNEVYGYRYAYDVTGNRIRARINGANTYYFYDQANQLKVTGSTSAYATPTYYIYDRNGSLTNLVAPTGATYFAYNAANLVARMRWADASATYFFYDGTLQRFALVAAGQTAATYFLWDGLNLLQELNADFTVKEEHTHAKTPIGGIGQLVETNRPGQSPQKFYPIQDPRGSITKQIQSDGTTVQATREYDAFGQIIPNSASGTWLGRFGYQGQAWMEIFSGNGSQRLLLSPTRIYDTGTGRFLQNEPLLVKRPYSHYVYTRQNPVINVDPSGRDTADQVASVMGILWKPRKNQPPSSSNDGLTNPRHSMSDPCLPPNSPKNDTLLDVPVDLFFTPKYVDLTLIPAKTNWVKVGIGVGATILLAPAFGGVMIFGTIFAGVSYLLGEPDVAIGAGGVVVVSTVVAAPIVGPALWDAFLASSAATTAVAITAATAGVTYVSGVPSNATGTYSYVVNVTTRQVAVGQGPHLGVAQAAGMGSQMGDLVGGWVQVVNGKIVQGGWDMASGLFPGTAAMQAAAQAILSSLAR